MVRSQSKPCFVIPQSLALFFVALYLVSLGGVALGAEISYQGELKLNGAPANGSFDLRFELYDSPGDGSQEGATDIVPAATVANGLFIVGLDFGEGVFDGAPLWIEIAVRHAGGSEFVILSPRQPVTFAPRAIFSELAASALSADSALSAVSASNADQLQGLGAESFLRADGSNAAQGLNVEGALEVDSILFPDGTVQTTADTAELSTVTTPEIFVPAVMFCGTYAESDAAQWAAIALGSLRLVVDGVAHDVTVGLAAGLPAGPVMEDVAAEIEAAIRGATGGLETVTWNGNRFVVASGDTTSSSDITSLEPHGGGVGIDISGNGAQPWMDCGVTSGVGVANAFLDTDAYAGRLVRLDDDAQIDPFFVASPVRRGHATWNPTAVGQRLRIEHGLGRTPSSLKITAFADRGLASIGSYDGSGYSTIIERPGQNSTPEEVSTSEILGIDTSADGPFNPIQNWRARLVGWTHEYFELDVNLLESPHEASFLWEIR